MDEVTAPAQQTSSVAVDRNPELSLRLRQRDRLSPRGRFGKIGRITTTVREVAESPGAGIALAPAPRSKARSPDFARKKQVQDGLRKEASVYRRAKREAEDLKFGMTPDGGSAGREGRQFTVANVGNNGRIYLRPTIRPATQRYPQPSFVFPITPPGTAGLDALVSRKEAEVPERDSLWSPTRTPPTPVQQSRDGYFEQSTRASQAGRPRRAFSQSTIDENQVHKSARDSDIGAFRVVIERPGDEPRSEEPSTGLPILEIPIPSYKLGTPRFSTRGTAFLRGSSYTTTDDMRSSIFSGVDASRRNTGPDRRTRIISRRHSDASAQMLHSGSPLLSPLENPSSTGPRIIRQCTRIVPDMFDDLTFKPACDHPSVVRYSVGGGIRAATPARLVAEITSPTFVDYDLLSDFFLTFRTFLDTSDLLHMLIARLKWALLRTDETGIVVRVRTFVAIRHWILNYFLDDYVIDYELRESFCELLNKFVDELSTNPAHAKVPRKILGELKKCWRRVCALYWDGTEFNTDLGPDVPIRPGGVAGSRDPNLDPSFWAKNHTGPPRLDDIIEPDFLPVETSVTERHNYFAEVSRAGHMDSVITFQQADSANKLDEHENQPPLSPTSIMSDDFVSCSFPSRGRVAGSSQPLGAHPVPASSIYDQAPPIAMTPKALTGKRVRPNHAHKRSASFSDSFRDHRVQQQPVQKVLYKSTELLLALPYAGSLVRGNLFPPAQGFVEDIAPSTPAEVNRTAASLPGILANQKGPSAMSGPGMKKLLGSVRRALSTKNGTYPNSSPTQGSFPNIPPLGVRGATINRLPGTAVVPQARPRNTESRAPMRIDLLGAEVAEDFKKAVQEDADADSERQEQEEARRISTASSKHDPNLHYSVMRLDETIDAVGPANRRDLVSEVTTGSKSIVIMDETNLPIMTGALPVNPSVDTFAEVFNQPSGGPTPPSTPPELTTGIPRRSSHLLGEHTRATSRPLSFEQTPSLVGDSRPSGDEERFSFPRPLARLSMRPRAYSHGHKNSLSLRKYASYQSGFTRHRSERSFDATTVSGTEEIERLSQIASAPPPLRVLRRRPGGDLRAVTNVGDLNTNQLRRPMSTGSIATYSDSVRSSFLRGSRGSGDYGIASSNYDHNRPNENAFSLGVLAEVSPKSPASLFSTHSSQPVMRPSFEKEAKYLAQIPDDDDDDGGVESALLKLEGKFQQRRSDGSGEGYNTNDPGAHNSFGAAGLDMSSFAINRGEDERRKHRQNHVVDSTDSETQSIALAYPSPHASLAEELKPAVYQPHGTEAHQRAMSPRSMDSYNSIPLLDRGFTDDGKGQEDASDWSQHSILCGPSNERLHAEFENSPGSSHPNSFDFIIEAETMKRSVHSPSKPSHDSVTQSFLDMGSDSDNRSDLSSEMSLEVISRTEYTENDASSTHTFPPIRAGTVIREMPLPAQTPRPPPSPSLTLVQALMLSPKHIDNTQHGQMHKYLPPTPQVSPTAANATTFDGNRGASPSMNPLGSHRIPEASRKTSIHLPFTLAFDSKVLAQQFTLIEKDALNEIDWKDLIEMPWKDSSTESRSWVDFLRTSEPRGVEVVIARFNLVVKWAVSEIVLTQDLSERVRCIIKYIHIAAHCRRYRNFATMTQLTVALTSNDITRLTSTWASVPHTDIQTLRELEAIVTPMGNFYNIRAEMEGSGAGEGCIPFVGIYTHDLLVNSERPSQFASTPTTEPLVNFERCRTDAAIVKNLLRLLEASQLYRFLPIEGITERCLWMAALSDEEISRYGRLIQE